MRVESSLEISAAPALVWEYVADPSRYLHFMSGITRWEVVGSKRSGLGIEIVEFMREADLAWTSITGVDQRGRWRLRSGNGGRSTVTTLRLSYGVAGSGISGWLAEHVAAPSVRGHLRRSLQQLKRQVEHDQLRAAAAERRRSRMGAA